jgi:hypothetical protein
MLAVVSKRLPALTGVPGRSAWELASLRDPEGRDD